MPGAQIKDEKTYQKLRERGESKEKSARIANGAAGSPRRKVAKGGERGSYQDMSKADLVKRAREVGIKGRSSMKERADQLPTQSLTRAAASWAWCGPVTRLLYVTVDRHDQVQPR